MDFYKQSGCYFKCSLHKNHPRTWNFCVTFNHNYIKLRHTTQTVCKWRVNPEKDDNGKTWRGRNGMYGMVSAKMGSSFTSCACKEMFCVQQSVKITEEGT